MAHASLIAPEIHCGHCKMSIEGAVGALAGIDGVEVSVEETKVDVNFDEAAVDLDTIKQVIEDQGYAVFG